MNKVLYLLFISIFWLDYLSLKLNLISRYVTWLPEILSICAVTLVALYASRGDIAIRAKYVIFFIVFLVHISIGIVLNAVPAGPMVIGLRTYLKFLPFFLLPAVYSFTDAQVRNQLRFLLFLVLLQSPLAIFQKFNFLERGKVSGDWVTGTLTSSGQLNVVLVCAIAVVMGFYLSKKIKFVPFCMFLCLLFVPNALNESKASVIYLPVAMMGPAMLLPGYKEKLKKLLPLFIIVLIFSVAFIGLYDKFKTNRASQREGLIAFFTTQGRMEHYLYRAAEAGKPIHQLGIIDSILLPLQVLSKDIFKLGFGLGIGNVSGSFLSSLSGEYAKNYGKLGAKSTAIGLFLWEIGLLGVLLYLLLIYMIFSDARYLSRRGGLYGSLGPGWGTVMILVGMALFQKNIFLENVTGYLFWYLSGYVAATRCRFSREAGSAGRAVMRSLG